MAWTSLRVLVCVLVGSSLARETAGVEASFWRASTAAAQDSVVAESGAKGEAAFKKALARLKSADAGERAAAADEMGRRGYRFRKVISDNLRPLLIGDPDSVVRAAAGRALGRLGSREALPELVKALEDRAPEVRVVAAAALWRLPDPSAVPALLVCVRDRDKAVREWSALALGVAADNRAVPELIRLLSDPERSVRLAAIRSLGRVNHKDGLKPLVLYLSHGRRDDEEREEVVNSISSIEAPERTAALLQLLTSASKDEKLRLHLALALGKVGESSALPTLRKLGARDGSKSVREAATQSSAAILGRSKGKLETADAAPRP